MAGHRLLGYSRIHDQIGNRAQGDRLSALLSPGLLACAATLTLTAPFTPMLFMGEEWAATTPWQFFTDHTDPELAEAVRRGQAARVRLARVGRGGRTRPAGPGDPGTVLPGLVGPERSPTRACWPGTAG
ncbi:hypothetical protein LT493_39365 [Streptomyces tricolor]|nr:hypothetical protein [Streptomyces tricolor]